MSRFELDTSTLKKEAHMALFAWVNFAHNKIIEITPRDEKRMPQNIDRKDGKIPIRNTWPFRPVFKNWHWYVWVSGNLRKSVQMEEVWPMDFIIWVQRWPTEEYAWAQEFWTPSVPARSFLRKWIIDNSKDIFKVMETAFYQLSSR